MDVVRGFFGMLSDCRLFTCGTRGIMFHFRRSPAPFALTNVEKIAVFVFNPVNDACYFSSYGRSFGFLKTEASVRMGLKAVFMLSVAVCILPCPISLEHRVPRQGQQGQDGGFVGQTLFGQHFQ